MEVYFADICRGTLYIDDGSMNQKYLIYHFSCYKKDGKTELSVSIDDHGYPGLKVLKFKFHGVKLNSTETEGTKILKGKNILEMPGSISKAIFH